MKPKKRIFIVAPTDAGKSLGDKIHHICSTRWSGPIADIYSTDSYEVIADRLSLQAAKKFALELGAKRPKVI